MAADVAPADESATLRPDDRAQLERIARALGLGHHKRAQLVLEFQHGRLAWWEPRPIRLPASRLDELAENVASFEQYLEGGSAEPVDDAAASRTSSAVAMPIAVPSVRGRAPR